MSTLFTLTCGFSNVIDKYWENKGETRIVGIDKINTTLIKQICEKYRTLSKDYEHLPEFSFCIIFESFKNENDTFGKIFLRSDKCKLNIGGFYICNINSNVSYRSKIKRYRSHTVNNKNRHVIDLLYLLLNEGYPEKLSHETGEEKIIEIDTKSEIELSSEESLHVDAVSKLAHPKAGLHFVIIKILENWLEVRQFLLEDSIWTLPREVQLEKINECYNCFVKTMNDRAIQRNYERRKHDEEIEIYISDKIYTGDIQGPNVNKLMTTSAIFEEKYSYSELKNVILSGEPLRTFSAQESL